MRTLSVLIILIVSLIVWSPILSQVPMGEGYYYFNNCQNKLITDKKCATYLTQYDNLARLSFQIMIPIFKDNIHSYMYAQFMIMVALYTTFYLTLLAITKSNSFSLIATVLFLSNHTGSFSMMASGNYQRFAQRVPNLIPTIISFYYLAKYLISKKKLDITISVCLFAISMFLSHHGMFIIPMFIVYIFVQTVTEKLQPKDIIRNALIAVILAIIALLTVKSDNFVPDQTPLNFIQNTGMLTGKTLLQISNLFLPSNLIIFIAKIWPFENLKAPYTKILSASLLPISFIILMFSRYIKRYKKMFILYLTSVLMLPIVSLLNLYAYGAGTPDPLRNFGEDRIYFISSIFSNLILAGIIYVLTISRYKVIKIMSYVLFLIIIINNNNLIKIDARKLEANSKKMMDFIAYNRLLTKDKNKKVLIIGPSHLLWPSEFTNKFYNTNNNLVIALDSSLDINNIDKKNWDRILLINYDEKKPNGQILEKVIK